MRFRGLPALALGAMALVGAPAGAQAPAPEVKVSPQAIAQRAYLVLDAIHKDTRQSQDGALRKCRANMEQALSAEKLGAPDMAAKYWEVAARGCKGDALLACRQYKASAPAECAAVSGL